MARFILINHRFDHFSPQFPSSPGIVLYEYCRAAIAAGDEPVVISSPGDNPPHSGIRVEFVQPPPEPATPLGRIAARARRRLRGERYLRQARYIRDVAAAIRGIGPLGVPIVTNGDPDLAVALAEIFPNSAVVNVFHHHETYKPILYERFRRGRVRLAAVSNFLARKIEAGAALPTGTIATVYNGVDPVAFSPAPVRDLLMPPVVSYHGHIGHAKGVDMLLDAAEILRREGREFRIQIIGKEYNDEFVLTDYEEDLQARIAALREAGLEIRIPGWVGRDRLPLELHRAQIHVVPSRCDEGFGMATLEGMACGLATVASRTGGTPEVVGDSALLFEREDVAQLAERLVRLIRNPELRLDYGRRASRRAALFTWANSWWMLKSVLAGRPCSPSA